MSAISASYLRDCEVIMSSHLAEWQKLDAYRRFIFPRLQHVFRVFFPGSSWCKRMDMRARKWLKKAVRLPLRSCTEFLYTPQALSGLGVPNCEDDMHVARVAQAFKFLADTRDPIVRQIAILHFLLVPGGGGGSRGCCRGIRGGGCSCLGWRGGRGQPAHSPVGLAWPLGFPGRVGWGG